MINKKIFAILGTALLSTSILAACGNKSTTPSGSKQQMNVAVIDDMTTLNTSKYSDLVSLEAIQNSYEGLYRFDQKGKPVLAGATKVSTNADKTVYTFDLRKDAKWTNGDPVTAQDYVYAWQKLADPKTTSPNSQRIDPIKNGQQVREGSLPLDQLGVKALDKYKLEVTLEAPIAYMDELMTGAPFYPQNHKVAAKYGEKYGTSSKNTVYNGPFVVKGWNGTNQTWSYVKNNSYWDKKAVKLNKVNVQVSKDSSTAGRLFQAGKIDYTALGNEYAQQYKSNKGFHSKKIPLIGYLGFNTKDELTGNVHVRKAIAQGYDRKMLVKHVLHAGSVLNGIVPANFTFNPTTNEDYRKQAGDLLPYNKKVAQSEWKKAKAELGNKKEYTLELLSSDMPESKQVVEYMQSQLEKNLPGLKVKVRSIPLKARLAASRNYDFQVVYGTWQPDYADPVNFIADGGQYHLNTDYTNKQFLDDLEKAKTTYATDPKKRFETLVDAETHLIKDDAYSAPVYQGAMTYLLNSKVKDLNISPYGTVLLYRDVYIK